MNSSDHITTPFRPTKKIPLMNSLNKSATSTPTSVKSTKDSTTPNTNKSLEPDLSAPQTIAIVAGRKYIMVPKTAKANATPDTVNGNQITKSS